METKLCQRCGKMRGRNWYIVRHWSGGVCCGKDEQWYFVANGGERWMVATLFSNVLDGVSTLSATIIQCGILVDSTG